MSLNFNQKFTLFLIRLGMGSLMLYAGVIKILDPSWTAKGYIEQSKVLPQFYSLLLQPDILPYVDIANKWGLALIGGALIIGFATRFAAFWGLILMILYYLPIYPPKNGLVDDHAIYALLFLLLITFAAGRIGGIDAFLEKSKFTRRHPWMGRLLG